VTSLAPPQVVGRLLEHRARLLEARHPLDAMVADLVPTEYEELERWWKTCTDEPCVPDVLFGMRIRLV
jgi:hypothetical protein